MLGVHSHWKFPIACNVKFSLSGTSILPWTQLDMHWPKPIGWTNRHMDDGIRTLAEQVPLRRLGNKEI